MKLLMLAMLALSMNFNQALAETSEKKDKITIFEISSGNAEDMVAMGVLTNQIPDSTYVLKDSFGTSFLAIRDAPNNSLDELSSIGLKPGEFAKIEKSIPEEQLKSSQIVMV